MSKKVKLIIIVLVLAVTTSLMGNIFAAQNIKAMAAKQNYSLYKVYTEASHQLNEGLNIIRDQIVDVKNEPVKPFLHEAFDAINTAHTLIEASQFLNEDFTISISNLQEYLRILSVQNDFQAEYDIAKLEEILTVYERAFEQGGLALEVPQGYSIGSIAELNVQRSLIDSLGQIEAISKEALEYHLSLKKTS